MRLAGVTGDYNEQIENVLKIVGMEERMMHMPGQMSGGEQQRLAIARAVLGGAPILLLDEATSALDMETESQLLTNLMNSGIVKTCILVTHRPAGKQLCNRNYHISDGSVAEVD